MRRGVGQSEDADCRVCCECREGGVLLFTGNTANTANCTLGLLERRQRSYRPHPLARAKFGELLQTFADRAAGNSSSVGGSGLI
jgi:hypothetical protein